jgi:DNA-binding NarL/FixJ family response regulator
MSGVRIVLADDHTLVRAGLRKLLEGVAGFEVVAEYTNGRDVLRGVRETSPDVVVMDIAMPELNGLDATARITRSDCACPVLILSMHATEQYVLEALRNGASGYVLKDADADELERAIRSVVRGEKYLTPAVSKHLLDDYMRRIRSDEAQESSATRTLTARQREILQLVAEGKSTREIAELLHLSVKTVETHRAQIMQRLEIYDVAGLTRYAIRTGIITG